MSITREQYIEQRLRKEVNAELAYEMYMSSPLYSTEKVGFQAFCQSLHQWIIVFRPLMKNYWSYCDNKFDLQILQDKEGNIIKCI